MIEVIAGAAIVLGSNAIMEWLGSAVSSGKTYASMPPGAERSPLSGTLARRHVVAGGEFVTADAPKSVFRDRRRATCDKASPAAAVMLHLRSCYVSKAAILTIPVQPVPVENRSPA
jgi:hypothetical protein